VLAGFEQDLPPEKDAIANQIKQFEHAAINYQFSRFQAIGPSHIVSSARKIPIIILSARFCPIKNPSKKPEKTCAHPYHFLRLTPKPILTATISIDKIASPAISSFKVIFSNQPSNNSLYFCCATFMALP